MRRIVLALAAVLAISPIALPAQTNKPPKVTKHKAAKVKGHKAAKPKKTKVVKHTAA